MGLFAVSHLAARHGVRVRLRPAAPRGLTALVWIPDALITAQADETLGWPEGQYATAAKPASGSGGWSAFGRHRSSRKPAASEVAASDAAASVSAASAPAGPVLAGPVLAGPVPADPVPADPVPASPVLAGGSVQASATSAGRGPEGSPLVIIPGAAEPVPIFESMASEWFRRGSGMARPGMQGPTEAGAEMRANWNSAADAGWRAAESAATPVRGQVTAAGLPQRIPRANMVPGSVGERRMPASAPPMPAGSAGQARPAGQPRSADTARARLAGFQRGTRRAQASGSETDRPTGP